MNHYFPGILILLAGALRADSTIATGARQAYAANLGWVNFRPDQPSSPNGVDTTAAPRVLHALRSSWGIWPQF